MDRISELESVAVPNKDIDCRDNELVHPEHFKQYAAAYAAITGRDISTVPELIRAFYAYHEDADFAGFKSMINRHPYPRAFIRHSGIQFITLLRRDVPSTIASFMAAKEKHTWRRNGGTPSQKWTFDSSDTRYLDSNISYVVQSNRILEQIPGAISLWYEECCRPDFENTRLDSYFRAHIAFRQPKPPTNAAEYVTNWDEFVNYVTKRVRSFSGQRARIGTA